MSARSPAGYQPISQSIDEVDEESDVGIVNQPSSSQSIRGSRRRTHPGSIDIKKLDNAFKRQVSPMFVP